MALAMGYGWVEWGGGGGGFLHWWHLDELRVMSHNRNR